MAVYSIELKRYDALKQALWLGSTQRVDGTASAKEQELHKMMKNFSTEVLDILETETAELRNEILQPDVIKPTRTKGIINPLKN